ncbi:thermostable carboxypeptidase 1 [Arthrobacter sp. Hiyo4]|nr:thermostable carboxypeptidase 1 [Arthrobacter sp. Hiyo4]
MSITTDARELQGEIARFRHELHQEPEIGLNLPRTQEKVLKALDGLPFEITLGKSTTSVTAVLRGSAPHASATKPAVLLRADMDGLPVQERTGARFSSKIDGAMHACGHDLHTAMLAGAATLLAERRDQLAGDVVLMFQPGEEGFDGAGHMIREGVLEAPGAGLMPPMGCTSFPPWSRMAGSAPNQG